MTKNSPKEKKITYYDFKFHHSLVWFILYFCVYVYLIIVSCFSITITTPGKKTAIAANAIPPLVSLVDDDTSEVRANSLKVSTCTFTQVSVPDPFIKLIENKQIFGSV